MKLTDQEISAYVQTIILESLRLKAFIDTLKHVHHSSAEPTLNELKNQLSLLNNGLSSLRFTLFQHSDVTPEQVSDDKSLCRAMDSALMGIKAIVAHLCHELEHFKSSKSAWIFKRPSWDETFVKELSEQMNPLIMACTVLTHCVLARNPVFVHNHLQLHDSIWNTIHNNLSQVRFKNSDVTLPLYILPAALVEADYKTLSMEDDSEDDIVMVRRNNEDPEKPPPPYELQAPVLTTTSGMLPAPNEPIIAENEWAMPTRKTKARKGSYGKQTSCGKQYYWQNQIVPETEKSAPYLPSTSKGYRLPPCEHKEEAGCSLTNSQCCACLDKRPYRESELYECYVDGMGSVEGAIRSQFYCPPCQKYFEKMPIQAWPHLKQ